MLQLVRQPTLCRASAKCWQVDEHYYGTAIAVAGMQWETDCKGVLTSSVFQCALSSCASTLPAGLRFMSAHGFELARHAEAAGTPLTGSTRAESSMRATWGWPWRPSGGMAGPTAHLWRPSRRLAPSSWRCRTSRALDRHVAGLQQLWWWPTSEVFPSVLAGTAVREGQAHAADVKDGVLVPSVCAQVQGRLRGPPAANICEPVHAQGQLGLAQTAMFRETGSQLAAQCSA